MLVVRRGHHLQRFELLQECDGVVRGLPPTRTGNQLFQRHRVEGQGSAGLVDVFHFLDAALARVADCDADDASLAVGLCQRDQPHEELVTFLVDEVADDFGRRQIAQCDLAADIQPCIVCGAELFQELDGNIVAHLEALLRIIGLHGVGDDLQGRIDALGFVVGGEVDLDRTAAGRFRLGQNLLCLAPWCGKAERYGNLDIVFCGELRIHRVDRRQGYALGFKGVSLTDPSSSTCWATAAAGVLIARTSASLAMLEAVPFMSPSQRRAKPGEVSMLPDTGEKSALCLDARF